MISSVFFIWISEYSSIPVLFIYVFISDLISDQRSQADQVMDFTVTTSRFQSYKKCSVN